jgi:hypothetical protein
MQPDGMAKSRRRVLHVLAGLQAGVLGGVAMLAWLIVSAPWRQQPWWAFPNLMASGLFGEAVFRLGFGVASLSGIALLLVMAGILGSIFALLVPESISRFRFVLLAVATGLVWYYATASRAVNQWAPLVPLYTPKVLLYCAHLIYGFSLALERRHFRKIAGTTGTPPQP